MAIVVAEVKASLYFISFPVLSPSFAVFLVLESSNHSTDLSDCLDNGSDCQRGRKEACVHLNCTQKDG